ncbi:UDP-glucosyl transferase family [Fusarium coicis]|nr:UDP-glucosyl transferase family [Fusarium coicis]
MSLPKANILVVVTVGGSTNSARGHTIDFATLKGREKLVDNYPSVQKVHVVGPEISAEEDEKHYILFSRWNWNTAQGRRDIVKGKMAFDAFWPFAYRGMKHVITTTKPDFIFSDFHVEATLDKYIPGQPGMQQRCLTSEHASIYDRLFEMTFLLRSAPFFLHWIFWAKAMRRKEGVAPRPKLSKPDYLVFLNNFYGMETPRDTPPLVHAVGPILADSYPSLDGDIKTFVETHQKVALVAFGTHVILDDGQIFRIINGLADAISSGVIDGVVWALSARSRGRLDTSIRVPSSHLSHLTIDQLFKNQDRAWHFATWVPQRSVLEHDSTVIFVTHAGPSSVNESIFHGVPMVAMGIFGDQMVTTLRLERSGVAVRLDKETFDAASLTVAIRTILLFDKESLQRNVKRMQRIAMVLESRKKHFSADLIE